MWTFLRNVTLLLVLSLPGHAFAEDKLSWLFVISGTVEAASSTDLTIDASPLVIAFTDRPDREVRALDLEMFVDGIWNAGKNDFKDNPPNAAAIINGKRVEIETLQSISLDGSKVTFSTKDLRGQKLAAGDTFALVIDEMTCAGCYAVPE